MKLKPLDFSMIEDTSMYDQLPYQRDSDRCNAGAVALYSGNIVKYYRCSFGNAIELTDMDTLAAVKIKEYTEREKERFSSVGEETEIIDFAEETAAAEGLSEEQLDELLADKPKKKALLGEYDDEDF